MRGVTALAVLLCGLAAGPAAAGVFVITGPNGYRKIVNVPDPPANGGRVPQGSVERRSQVWPVVESACRTHGVDPAVVDLMIRMESGYNQRAVSPKGARGLMQLMPGTASLYGVTDSFDATQNVGAGVRYFRHLLERFGSDLRLALAAYNAGPEAVARYNGVPPYRETQNYVGAILAAYRSEVGPEKPLLSGGFGRPPQPGRPVELSAGAGEPTISNEPRFGEAVITRRLGFQ